MDDVARVVLAVEAQEVAEEVLHFLDRSGRARVVATAADDRQLQEAVRQLEPEVVVAEPTIAIASVGSATLLTLALRESIASLRVAIAAGADGFYVWPQERDGLLRHVTAIAAARRVPERRATVVAVHAARGGAGCTFVSTQLAQAFAKRDARCLLVECDLTYADLTQALGFVDTETRTMSDLVAVSDEMGVEHLEGVWIPHDAGFDVVLGPAGDHTAPIGDDLLRTVIGLAAASADVVVLHLPRDLSPVARWCFEQADRIVEVLVLDVLSFRATSRALESLSSLAVRRRVGFVVNRAARSEITPGDVRRVFDDEPLVVVPADASIPRLQDHGRIAPPKGRVGRAFDRLADQLAGDPERIEEEAS
jgi:MinD-like ATPase involved in chromosome partitioning or flagellar assembly